MKKFTATAFDMRDIFQKALIVMHIRIMLFTVSLNKLFSLYTFNVNFKFIGIIWFIVRLLSI